MEEPGSPELTSLGYQPAGGAAELVIEPVSADYGKSTPAPGGAVKQSTPAAPACVMCGSCSYRIFYGIFVRISRKSSS